MAEPGVGGGGGGGGGGITPLGGTTICALRDCEVKGRGCTPGADGDLNRGPEC